MGISKHFFLEKLIDKESFLLDDIELNSTAVWSSISFHLDLHRRANERLIVRAVRSPERCEIKPRALQGRLQKTNNACLLRPTRCTYV
jgi:hypothetical protein